MKENQIQNPLYKYKKLIFIFIIIFLTVIVAVLNSENIEMAILEVTSTRFDSIIILTLLLGIHIIADTYVLKVAIADIKVNYGKCFLINMTGCFFSGITPMYIGSYPSRLYYLYKEDISINKALSALTIRGLTYQMVLLILSFIALLYSNKISIDGYRLFLLLGFAYNFTITMFLILISSSIRFNKWMIQIIEKLSNRISFLKHRKEEIMMAINNYYTNTRRIYKDRSYFLTVLGFTILKMLAFFLMPLVVFYGLGLPINQYWMEILTISFLMSIIVSVFPTPGGMAASESVFIILYSIIFTSRSTVEAGMLIWRMFSYYFVIIIGLGTTLILQAREPKNISLKWRKK